MRASQVIIAALAFLSTAALAQRPVTLPGQPDAPAALCGPGSSGPACQSIREAVPGGIPGLITRSPPPPPPANIMAAPPPRYAPDLQPQRLLPPRILAMLRDPRIDPLTRAMLQDLAGRRREEWTVQDLQTVSAVIPTLAEMQVPTARLSELYEFLGLDPASLFEPQLGQGWQGASTEFDRRKARLPHPECVVLGRQARLDPASVRVQAMLTCGED
ncbi:hypothetical protein ACFOD4_03185 [Pseudoroseomonas globiformis]|uniref:Uncharacterized protein n=1 Tax=Teichococcus globiformis TaxID=2307229 RepID=A0ABV7FUL5_9PROT